MTTAIISHPDCRRHKMDVLHPEQPGRIDDISDRLIASGLEYSIDHFDANDVLNADLLRVHGVSYIRSLYERIPHEGLVNIDGDTQMCANTLKAANRAAGSGVQAVDLVMQGSHQAVFCNVRPPGHHAYRDIASGFCFYNNIAIAASHALSLDEVSRVAIIDFDVHHGDGTEDIFKDSDDVLFCSLFQHPFYPFSDPEPQHENHIKSPMSAGEGSQEFKQLVSEDWIPAIEKFEPQLIFISAGFDSHRNDDMGHINLDDPDYAWVTQQLSDYAQRDNCMGIISMLEGGYEQGVLGRSALAHIKALARL
ncbi:MAG: histone deacetylase family protein [Psychrobium sp.]